MSNKDKARVEIPNREDELKGLLNCCLSGWVANWGLLTHLIEMDKKYNGGVNEINQNGSTKITDKEVLHGN